MGSIISTITSFLSFNPTVMLVAGAVILVALPFVIMYIKRLIHNAKVDAATDKTNQDVVSDQAKIIAEQEKQADQAKKDEAAAEKSKQDALDKLKPKMKSRRKR